MSEGLGSHMRESDQRILLQAVRELTEIVREHEHRLARLEAIMAEHLVDETAQNRRIARLEEVVGRISRRCFAPLILAGG